MDRQVGFQVGEMEDLPPITVVYCLSELDTFLGVRGR